MALHLVAPEFDYAPQVELTDDLVRLDQGVHVGLEAMLSINGLLIKLDLNEAIRVRSDDEVDLRPVDHDDFLDIVHDIRQLLWRESLQTAIKLCRSEVSIEDLLVVEPLCPEQVFLCRLIRVVVHEVGDHVVFLLLFWQEAVVVLPVVLVHSKHEWSLMDAELFALLLLALVLLVLEEHGVFVGLPVVVAEQAATGQGCHFGSRLAPDQICVLLVIHLFRNGVGQQIRRQVPQRSVVAHSEAPHDCILLFIREVVKELGEIR